MATRNYIGKGKVKIQKKSGGIISAFGNCKTLSVQIETERKALQDYEESGGGEAEAFERIKSLKGSLEVSEYSPRNLAIGLRGTERAVAAGTVTGEAHVAFKGGYIVFHNTPDPTVPPVIKKGATPLVLGTDYQLRRDGVYILPGTTAIVDEDAITADYTRLDMVLVEALTSSGEEYVLYFEGLNEANGDSVFPARAHRITFSPTSGLDFIADDFGQIKLDFSCLKDASITTAGLSKYLQIGLPAEA